MQRRIPRATRSIYYRYIFICTARARRAEYPPPKVGAKWAPPVCAPDARERDNRVTIHDASVDVESQLAPVRYLIKEAKVSSIWRRFDPFVKGARALLALFLSFSKFA